jgi:hypothetical protein
MMTVFLICILIDKRYLRTSVPLYSDLLYCKKKTAIFVLTAVRTSDPI